MKEKTKEFAKSYLIGLILGIVVSGTIGVIAATYFPSNQTTYDNTNTELKSENVQDAIDELYGVCFPKTVGDSILDDADIVTSGDGLYEDEYEDGRYFYKGSDPNNYVTFNDEAAGWRIISVECDGTIKIMRNESIGDMAFDTTGGTYGNNNWDRPADIKTYLNDTYLPTITTNADKIVSHTWSIGGVTYNNTDLAGQIVDENGTQSQATSIGMITASEYLRANTNTEQCENMSINNTNRTTCLTTNWMYNIVPSRDYLWTISPNASNSNLVFKVSGNTSNAGRLNNNANNSNGVYPTLYLTFNITLTGDGSSSNPYIIMN